MSNFFGFDSNRRMSPEEKALDAIRVNKNRREFCIGFGRGMLAAGSLCVVLYGRSIDAQTALADLIPSDILQEILQEGNQTIINRTVEEATKTVIAETASISWTNWLNPLVWLSALAGYPFSFALGLTCGLTLARFKFRLLKPFK